MRCSSIQLLCRRGIASHFSTLMSNDVKFLQIPPRTDGFMIFERDSYETSALSDIPWSRRHMITSFTVWRANLHGRSFCHWSLFQLSNAWPPWHLRPPSSSPVAYPFGSFASETCPRSPSRTNTADKVLQRDKSFYMCFIFHALGSQRVREKSSSLQIKCCFALKRVRGEERVYLFFEGLILVGRRRIRRRWELRAGVFRSGGGFFEEICNMSSWDDTWDEHGRKKKREGK